MRNRILVLSAGLAAALGSLAAGQSSAQMIVTVMGKRDAAPPAVMQSQVQVKQKGDPVEVTSWQPYTAKDRLDLVLALDDDSVGMASRLADIKDFITSLPPNVALGLVYFHTGTAQIAQAFTFDHTRVANELRAPTGGSSPSPYGSLQALLTKWPRHPDRRRELIMVSDGEEHLGGNDSNNLTYQHAMSAAVADGVVVYTIYVRGVPEQQGIPTPGPGPNSDGGGVDSAQVGVPLGRAGQQMAAAFGPGRFDTPHGLANLAEISKESGGQSYSQGTETPTRFQPFLSDIAAHLRAQYQLAFVPRAGQGLEPVQVEIKNLHDAHMLSANAIYLGH